MPLIQTPNFRSWVDRVSGKRLANVLYEVMVYDGKVLDDPNPMALALRFQKCGDVPFNCFGDGSSLVWFPHDDGPSHIGEQQYSVLKSAFHLAPWRAVTGVKLNTVHRVYSEFSKTDIGITLNFENGASVSIINLGDELWTFDQISSETIASEQLRFLELG